MSTPSVSLIVSTYNQPQLISALIPVLSSQDFHGDWEVLICDDGSSGPLPAAIVSQRDLDIRYIWQSDRGYRLSRSRNNAIRCAQGDLLVFVDADVLFDPHFVSCHVAEHISETCLVMGSRSLFFLGDQSDCTLTLSNIDDRIREIRGCAKYSTYASQRDALFSRHPWTAMIGCNFSVPRKVAVRFDEHFVGWGLEDRELACRLAVRHGYVTRATARAEVIHFESGTESDFFPVRPRNSAEIMAYIRNIVYFCGQYPEIDMEPVWNSLRYYEYDSNSGIWIRAANTRPAHGEIARRITQAIEWARATTFAVQEVAAPNGGSP